MQGKMRKHKIQRKHRIKRQECEEIKNICTVATESLNCRSSFADVEKKKFNSTESKLDKLHSSNDKVETITPVEITLCSFTAISLIYTR